MGFGIFMLIMVLLLPITMTVLGSRYMRSAPKMINPTTGYRSVRSMKSQDSWDFAHQYVGRIWFIMGLVCIPLSLLPMVLVLGKEAGEVGLMGGILVAAQMIPLGIVPIILTERALRKNFDEFGVSCDQSSGS